MGLKVSKNIFGIIATCGTSSILILSILFVAPFGINNSSILEPQQAYAFTLNSIDYDIHIQSMTLQCLAYTQSADNQGMAGSTTITMEIFVDQSGASSATEYDVLLRYTPHDASATHLPTVLINLMRDFSVPGSGATEATVVTFSLPSHIDATGDTGSFKIFVIDDNTGFISLSYPYTSCPLV